MDDDVEIRRLLTAILTSEGFEVVTADGALSAVHELASPSPPHLVLLDVGLPGVDGIEVLTRVRRSSDLPVIILTGRGDQDARVAGLRAGADDYVVKPFVTEELLARIEAVMRRSSSSPVPVGASPGRASASSSNQALHFPGLVIDASAREVFVAGEQVAMTAREFDLLAFLAQSPRQVFTRDQLLHHVWDSSREWQDDATVTEHVRRIRQKIELDPDQPSWVVTVRGVGYRFEP